MPLWSVTMHVTGRFRVGSAPMTNDGAYTRRFITSADAASAGVAAVEGLRSDGSFLAFHPLPGDVPLRITVDEVRPAHWLERARSLFLTHVVRRGPGYIFYSENEGEVADGIMSPNTSLER